MPRAKRTHEAAEGEADEQLDQNTETDTLTGPVAEGIPPALAETLAKRLGWKSKEEWTGDAVKHIGAPEYLEQTSLEVEDLRARNRSLRLEKERSVRAAAEMLEEDRRRIREEALRTIRTAEDPEERARAADRIAQSAGPPPETQAWLAKNPWFHTDPDAQAIVVRTVNDLAAQKRPISEQLEEAEKKVRTRFPEYFVDGGEQRLSDVRRQAPTPPQVQSGSRAGGNGAAKEKGWAEVPRADREAFDRHLLKAFMSRGMKREEAQAEYAAGYWREGVLPPNEREEDPWVREKKANPWVTRGRR